MAARPAWDGTVGTRHVQDPQSTGDPVPPSNVRTPGNAAGIGAMVLATLLFTLGDAAMKLIAGQIPTGEAVFVRSILSALLCLAIALATGAIRDLPRSLQPLTAWRSLGDVGGALFFQAALARMPFADLMGILQMTPLSLTAASAIFLKETVGWRRWLAIGVGLVGALLVIKPGTSAFNVFAILGVLAVLCGSLRDVATRRLDPTLSPLVILMLSQVAVAAAALLWCLAFDTWVTPDASAWGHLVVASVMSMSGHLFMIAAVRSGDISAIAPFRYAGIVWAIIAGYVIWRELPDMLSLTGIAILTGAGLYAFHREQKLKRRRDRQRP